MENVTWNGGVSDEKEEGKWAGEKEELAYWRLEQGQTETGVEKGQGDYKEK